MQAMAMPWFTQDKKYSSLLMAHQLSGMDAAMVLKGRKNLPLGFSSALTSGS